MIVMTFEQQRSNEFMVNFRSNLPHMKSISNNAPPIDSSTIKIPKEDTFLAADIDDLTSGIEYSTEHLKEIKKTFDNRIISDNIRNTLNKNEIDEELRIIEDELNAFAMFEQETDVGSQNVQPSKAPDLRNNSLNRMLEKMRKKADIALYPIQDGHQSTSQSTFDAFDDGGSSEDHTQFTSFNTLFEPNPSEMSYCPNPNGYECEESQWNDSREDVVINKSIQTLLGDEPDYSKVLKIEEENKKWKLRSNNSIINAPLFSNLGVAGEFGVNKEKENKQACCDLHSNDSEMCDVRLELENGLEEKGVFRLKFPQRYKSFKCQSVHDNNSQISMSIKDSSIHQNLENNQVKVQISPKEKRSAVNKLSLMQNQNTMIHHSDNNMPPTLLNHVNSENFNSKDPKRMNIPNIPRSSGFSQPGALNHIDPEINSYYTPINPPNRKVDTQIDSDSFNYYSANPESDFRRNNDFDTRIQPNYSNEPSYGQLNHDVGMSKVHINNQERLMAPDLNNTNNNNYNYNNIHNKNYIQDAGCQRLSFNHGSPFDIDQDGKRTPIELQGYSYENPFESYPPFVSIDGVNSRLSYQSDQQNPLNSSSQNISMVRDEAFNQQMDRVNFDQELDESVLNYIISKDPVKRKILLMLSDGGWHGEYELIRSAKKERAMGFISFGVILESLNEDIHSQFINKRKNEYQSNQYRINPNHLSQLKKSLAAYDYT